MIDKRKFLKLLGFSYLLFLALPYRILSSATKKIINPKLSKSQKDIRDDEAGHRDVNHTFADLINMKKNKKTINIKNKVKEEDGKKILN